MFDHWGNRCHFWISSYAKLKEYFLPYSVSAPKIENLELNTDILKELNCQYLLTATEIVEPEVAGFKFLRAFESPETPLKVHLYEVTGKTE